ncbi:hypothetical protein PR048_012980 [Dryococelus australis]|uniref:Uncharacterized protein n=1 Tax=Dryococelus australis TaxID=614101 RepID=A0ABQ9HQW3_9NEOP|nr:hypothetical protein PR048_012980 [Dryococelus australis]
MRESKRNEKKRKIRNKRDRREGEKGKREKDILDPPAPALVLDHALYIDRLFAESHRVVWKMARRRLTTDEALNNLDHLHRVSEQESEGSEHDTAVETVESDDYIPNSAKSKSEAHKQLEDNTWCISLMEIYDLTVPSDWKSTAYGQQNGVHNYFETLCQETDLEKS